MMVQTGEKAYSYISARLDDAFRSAVPLNRMCGP